MATVKEKRIVLTHWQSLAGDNARRAAFRRKGTWVINSPAGSSAWYATVLSNLTGKYHPENPATLDSVRAALSAGLEKSAFELLKELTDISSEDLGQAIHVPIRTLARRLRFKPEESERLFRVASVFQKTLEVFDDLDMARRWFSTPKRALGEETPLAYCATELGAEEVRHLLGRIEHGVFT